MALTLPITVACALFADDMVLVLLGPKWKDAAPIFRLLAPTILVFAIINPLVWLLSSLGSGRTKLEDGSGHRTCHDCRLRSGIALWTKGVAFAYSAVMMLWVIPVIAWSVHGTVISFRDILLAVSRPLASGIVAGGSPLESGHLRPVTVSFAPACV